MGLEASATLTEEVRPAVYDNGVICSLNQRLHQLFLWKNFVLPHARIMFDENGKRTSHRTAML